jgi:hypothetical protein
LGDDLFRFPTDFEPLERVFGTAFARAGSDGDLSLCLKLAVLQRPLNHRGKPGGGRGRRRSTFRAPGIKTSHRAAFFTVNSFNAASVNFTL